MRAEAAEPTTVTSIAPMLSVRQGARAVEFYKAVFGAVEVFRIDAPDGAVVARLSVEGAEFWVADEAPEHQNFSPATLGGSTTRMVVTVQDPDAMFARAVAAGAQAVVAVKEDYGWRLGRAVDPFGHHWEIGRPCPTCEPGAAILQDRGVALPDADDESLGRPIIRSRAASAAGRQSGGCRETSPRQTCTMRRSLGLARRRLLRA